ncbi:MAG: hypothetical protein AMXMBFR59_30860 [Rhodanobacteraceae bacterium]
MLLRTGFTFALCALSTGALGQHWRGLGPGGGSVSYLLADPTTPGRVYATALGVSVSADAGRTWAPASTGLGARAAIGFVADPDSPGRLYFVDTDGRMMRSDNGAQGWAATGYQFGIDAAPFGYSRLPMADVPGSTTTLLLAGNDSVLYRSVDAGVSFSGVSYILPWNDRKVEVLAVDPSDPDVVLAGVGPGSVGSIFGATLLRSTNGGRNWDGVSGEPGLGVASDIAFVPDGKVLAVLNGRVHVSGDHGATWTSSDVPAQRIAVSPIPPYEAVAMTATTCWRSADFLAGSSACDSGLPVDPAYAGFNDVVAVADGTAYRALATGNIVGVRALSSESGAWVASGQGFSERRLRGLAIAPDASRLFAGRWPQSLGEAAPMFSTPDRGLHWNTVLAEQAAFIRSVALDPTTANVPGTTRLYAAGYGYRMPLQMPINGGIFRSVDGGENWIALDQGLPTAGSAARPYVEIVRGIKLDPRSCASPPPVGPCRQGPLNTVFALASRDGWLVLKSTASGDDWMNGSGGLPPAVVNADGSGEYLLSMDIEFDAANGDVLLSTMSVSYDYDHNPVPGAIRSGVFRSTDGGMNWAHRSSGLPLMDGSAQTTRDVYALAAHPRRSGIYWASTVQTGGSARIYKTVDAGATWAASGPELTGCDVSDLQVNAAAPDVVYAVGIGVAPATSACIYRSEDGGANWTRVVAEPPFTAIYDVRWSEQDHSRLVMTTEKGLWELHAPSDRIFIEGIGD